MSTDIWKIVKQLDYLEYSTLPIPRGYSERLVDSEIPPVPDAYSNAKFDCFDFFVLLHGDNHCGYIGFRNLHPFGNILIIYLTIGI